MTQTYEPVGQPDHAAHGVAGDWRQDGYAYAPPGPYPPTGTYPPPGTFAAPEPYPQYGPYPPRPGMVAMPVQPAYPAYPDDRFGRFILRTWDRSPRWAAPLAVLFCFFGGVAYTLLTHPTSSDAASTPNCIIKLTTGFDCPGCGGTRAFYYLMQGNVLAAARSHLVLVFAAPYLVYMYVAWAAGAMFNWKLPIFRPSPRAISAFLGVWLAFSVLRNLPWAPFTWLYV
jgi:Protein of unknown function (DUF2752)